MDTVFSIQRFVEDYLSRVGIDDLDQYSVRVANLYADWSGSISREDLLARMRHIRTVVFRNNRSLNRAEIERTLLGRLDKRFQKKTNPSGLSLFPGGVKQERRRLFQGRRSIGLILCEFKRAVEARAIDAFWDSRRLEKLKSNPEKIAQDLLAMFIAGALKGKGQILREAGSGIGYIDIEVTFGSIPHLIELKILKGPLQGVSQLATYMRTENRSRGWLLLADARSSTKRKPIPTILPVKGGAINIVTVDINPERPCRQH